MYLTGLKLPVVYDSSWNDGCVIPVAAVAVILTRIITLSCLIRNTPYTTQHNTQH